MYSKDDGYIYFDDIEDAKALLESDGTESSYFWELNYDRPGNFNDWRRYNLASGMMNSDVTQYRRRLTPDFRMRREFCDGDLVSAYGVNGVIDTVTNSAHYQVDVDFGDYEDSFYIDGKGEDWHKNPSLSHGHDSTVDNQKYPVERIKTKKDQKAMSQADEVAECIPHWQENLRLAIEGEKINVAWEACCLCVKYFGKAKGDCHQCPIYKDTNEICCSATPYKKAISGNPKHVLEMLNYLIDLERRLRKAGK
jgi:hypothetical protein